MTGPLERRAADLARLADERWDLLIVGGGIVGAGALLDAVVARPQGRARRAGRHRGRHQLPLQPPDPRRAAVPPAGRGRPGPRGARRAGPAPAPGAAPRPPGDVPVPDLRAAGSSRARSTTVGLTAYDLLGSRRSGGRHRHLGRRRDPGLRAEPRAPRGPAGRAPLPRRDGGRRAVHARGRPHGPRQRARRRGRRHARPGTGPAARGRPRGRRHGRRPADRRRPSRSARPPCSTRPVSGARSRTARSGPAPFDRSCLARQPPRHPARAHPRPRRHDAADPGPRRASSSRGRGHWIIGTTDEPYHGPLDHVARQRRTRWTRSSARSTAPSTSTSPATTSSGRTRGLRPLVAPSDAGVHGQGLARAPGGGGGGRASSGSAAASTRPTG